MLFSGVKKEEEETAWLERGLQTRRLDERPTTPSSFSL